MSIALTVDWVFLLIRYFGVDERFGKRKDLRGLIDAAHQNIKLYGVAIANLSAID
ncbi:hypothetical protein [Nostoc sp.]|uniref:hypothetical protein n=1 Tax=Nostoc sp. TaxID=1180 RepID=UPI002FF89A7F